MEPTKLMVEMAAKMSNENLMKALVDTDMAIRSGKGSINLQGTRWMNLAALKAEAARRQW